MNNKNILADEEGIEHSKMKTEHQKKIAKAIKMYIRIKIS